MLAVGLGHHAVHVDDDGLALLGRRCRAASQVDIVVGTLALLEIDGVGVEHLAIDFHRAVVARHHDAVALTQLRVVVAAGVGHGLVELDTHGVGEAGHQLLHVDGVVAAVALGGAQHGLHLFALVLRHQSQQLGTLGIGALGQSARQLDDFAQALALVAEGVDALKLHLTLDGDVLLFRIAGTAAHVNLVERLQREVRLAGNLEVGRQREAERLGYLVVGLPGVGVGDAACHVHLHQRCCLGGTASLQDEVLDALVGGISVDAWIVYLTVDGDGLQGFVLVAAGNVDDVLVAQRHVGHGALQDAYDVYTLHLQ